MRFQDDNGQTHENIRPDDNKSPEKTRLTELEVEILEQGTARFDRELSKARKMFGVAVSIHLRSYAIAVATWYRHKSAGQSLLPLRNVERDYDQR